MKKQYLTNELYLRPKPKRKECAQQSQAIPVYANEETQTVEPVSIQTTQLSPNKQTHKAQSAQRLVLATQSYQTQLCEEQVDYCHDYNQAMPDLTPVFGAPDTLHLSQTISSALDPIQVILHIVHFLGQLSKYFSSGWPYCDYSQFKVGLLNNLKLKNINQYQIKTLYRRMSEEQILTFEWFQTFMVKHRPWHLILVQDHETGLQCQQRKLLTQFFSYCLQKEYFVMVIREFVMGKKVTLPMVLSIFGPTAQVNYKTFLSNFTSQKLQLEHSKTFFLMLSIQQHITFKSLTAYLMLPP